MQLTQGNHAIILIQSIPHTSVIESFFMGLIQPTRPPL